MSEKSCCFSIIIPTYNDKYLLSNALCTILNQSFKDFEIIIVDDSTNNEIEQYINGLKNICIKYTHNTPSLGPVKNWNYGISKAEGRYLILLHHDESFFDDKFSLQFCKSQFKLTDCDAIILNSIVNYPDGNSRKQRIPNFIKNLITTSIPSLLFSANLIGPTSCIIFKKEIFVPFNEELKWLVDVDWYYRLLKGRKIQIEQTTYISSIHGHADQITNTINIKVTETNDRVVIRNSYGNYSSVSLALIFRSCLYSIKKILNIKSNPFWKNNENR
jgi:glycosyltransferase involved in cell wall biosynthesis